MYVLTDVAGRWRHSDEIMALYKINYLIECGEEGATLLVGSLPHPQIQSLTDRVKVATRKTDANDHNETTTVGGTETESGSCVWSMDRKDKQHNVENQTKTVTV